MNRLKFDDPYHFLSQREISLVKNFALRQRLPSNVDVSPLFVEKYRITQSVGIMHNLTSFGIVKIIAAYRIAQGARAG